MNITRRDALIGTAASAGALLTGVAPALARQPAILRAQESNAGIATDLSAHTRVWGYNGLIPGPVLRVRQGDRVAVNFVNELPQASTVHWHGVRIDNAMDGVPGLTQAAVQPNGQHLYEFVAPDAGTYWYHPHNRTSEQMGRGLYGALIVEEPEPMEIDTDEILLIDDWRLTADGQIEESFGSLMDLSHAGRMGNWLTVNGVSDYRRPVKRNERLRLRVVNTANARIFTIGMERLSGFVVAIDGQPLPALRPADQIILGPAQRADIIVDVTGESGRDASLFLAGAEQDFPLATFPIEGSARTSRLPPPAPLRPNSLPPLGKLELARQTTILMEGGAMGSMGSAMMGGQMTGMRDLANAGRIWAFNGSVDMPDEPLIAAEAGETVRIRMINDTAWPHAMHLHGHHFRELSAAGRTGPLRDTLLMGPNETAEIVFVADNPGDWLLHCHMLEHAVSGMITWLKVNG